MNLRLFNVASSSIRFFHQEKARFASKAAFLPVYPLPIMSKYRITAAQREQFLCGNPGGNELQECRGF
jgi:hypothetical protein